MADSTIASPDPTPSLASVGLVQGANSANPGMDAYNTETTALQTQAASAQELQTAKDSVTAKILDYAGSGNVAEARYLAQQNNVQLPEEIYSNGKMAKLAATSQSLYPDDPNKASAFVFAGMKASMNPSASFMDQVMAGKAAAGPFTTPDQRAANTAIALQNAKSQAAPTQLEKVEANQKQQQTNSQYPTYDQDTPLPFPGANQQPSAGLTGAPTDSAQMPASGPPGPPLTDDQASALPPTTAAGPALTAPGTPAAAGDSALPVDNTPARPVTAGAPALNNSVAPAPAASSPSAPAPTPFGWRNEAINNIRGLPQTQIAEKQKSNDKISQMEYSNNKLMDNQMRALDNLEGLAKTVPSGGTANYQVTGANLLPWQTNTATQGTNFNQQAKQLVLNDTGFNYVPGMRGSDLVTQLRLGSKPDMTMPTASKLSSINEIRGKYMDSRISSDIDAQYRAANPYGHISGPEVDMIDRSLKQMYPITAQNGDKNTIYNAGNVAKIQALIPLVIQYGPGVLKNPEGYLKQSGFTPVPNVDSTAALSRNPSISSPNDPNFASLPKGASFTDNVQGSPTFGQVMRKH